MDLTAARRAGMPANAFAGPGRSFPVNDAEHARLAISGATRAFRAGHITAAEMASIKHAAERVLERQ